VTPNDFRENTFEDLHAKGAAQPQPGGSLEDGNFRFQLVENPQALLNEGDWSGRASHAARNPPGCTMPCTRELGLPGRLLGADVS
jgi:hypothetical protein